MKSSVSAIDTPLFLRKVYKYGRSAVRSARNSPGADETPCGTYPQGVSEKILRRLRGNSQGGEQDVDGGRQNQADNGDHMPVLPGRQVHRAHVLGDVFLGGPVLVQGPHDEELNRKQHRHGIEVVDGVVRAGVAGGDQQEYAVADHVEDGDDLRRIGGQALEQEHA